MTQKINMTKQEAQGFLTAVNQFDPRVEPSPFNAEIWWEHINHLTQAEALGAFKVFTGRSDDKPTPRQIKLTARSVAESKAAAESARQVTRGTTKITFGEWKRRHPGEAARCYEEGRRQAAAAHGVPYVPLPVPPRWAVENVSVVASAMPGGKVAGAYAEGG